MIAYLVDRVPYLFERRRSLGLGQRDNMLANPSNMAARSLTRLDKRRKGGIDVLRLGKAPRTGVRGRDRGVHHVKKLQGDLEIDKFRAVMKS